MKFLCDENLPVSLAAELRSIGLDAVDVRERNLTGANDDQVLAFAQAEGRIIVTLDVRRFGNLIATPPSTTPGLIVVRMPSASIRAMSDRIVRFLTGTEEGRISRALTILEANSSRRRT